jgi:hypothetical protein
MRKLIMLVCNGSGTSLSKGRTTTRSRECDAARVKGDISLVTETGEEQTKTGILVVQKNQVSMYNRTDYKWV